MLHVFLECSGTLLFHVQSLQFVSYGVIHVFQNMVSSPCNRVTKISVNNEDGDFLCLFLRAFALHTGEGQKALGACMFFYSVDGF